MHLNEKRPGAQIFPKSIQMTALSFVFH